jgi:uncharacterized membrane protein YgcG
MASPFYARRLLGLALALVAIGVLAPRPAAARSLELDSFDAQIRVAADGTMEVSERITASFTGSWNGIIRMIPVEYRTPQGLNYTLLLDDVRVTDDSGAPLRVQSSRVRHYRKLKIFIPGAMDAHRTFVISYRVLDGLRFFEDHDELYWNVTGDEWTFPIRNATARIELPAGTTGLRGVAFNGVAGSRDQNVNVEVDVGARTVGFRTLQSLAIHEGLTVSVAWDKGAVREPDLAAKAALVARSNWPLSVPFVVAALMGLLWYVRGRDPRLGPIVARYRPPEALGPAEVGALVDQSAGITDITASIVDLAVRGFLRIEETPGSKPGGASQYTFHLRKPREEWTALKPHETGILGGIFSDGATTVKLSELHNQFYKKVPAITDSIFAALLERGFYHRRPDRVRTRYMGMGGLVFLGTFFASVPMAEGFGMPPLLFFLTGFATSIVVWVIGWNMPARTVAGARMLEQVLGFEDFVSHVDADRFERTIKSPEMFEAFLPYAMALRVHKQWVAAFQDIYTEPPSWYGGSFGSSFDATGFVSRLDTMSSDVGSTLTSEPRSSSGSGSSGGGSSGGGFGGGGGSGF